MDKARELGESKVGPLMWKYFVPSFIGVFVNAVYNIVDRIYIGQGVGALALSGLTVVFPIMLIIMAFGMLVGVGSGVLVSLNMGRNQMDKAEKVLGNGFFMVIVISITLSTIGLLLQDDLLAIFGATAETAQYAKDYLNIILFGIVFQEVGLAMNNVIRSEGNAKIAMYSMLLSAGMNIILDPIFIFWLDMGVKGAAYATVISMTSLTIWVTLHFRNKRSVVKLHVENLKPDFSMIKEIAAIGMAPFFMQIANSFIQGLINTKLIRFGGDVAVGAMGVVNSVVTMIIMAIVAINMAAQPIISYNYGAKKFHRVKEALRLGIISASFLAVIAFILIQVFPETIVKVFNATDPDLLVIGSQGLKIGLFTLPVLGYQIVTSSFFQSVGKAKLATFLTLLRQVLVLIPLLFILPNFMGLKGIWLSMPISDAFSAVVVLFFLVRVWKSLDVAARESI